MHIELIEYKIISEKYIIVDKEGKGKEYSLTNNELVFEGKYFNGKRNGKGIEYYDNGNIKFEGEYLNGKRNGKGIKNYKNGKLKYKGDYLNGKKWNGKIYDCFNKKYKLKIIFIY